jgi:hypothetical protein
MIEYVECPKREIESNVFERDRYRCSGWSRMHVRSLSIHYIDGNSKNANPLNMISLCDTCFRLLHQMKRGIGNIQNDFKALSRLFLVIAKHRSRTMMRRVQISHL